MSNKSIMYASVKPTPELFALLERLRALEPNGLSYSEVYERAERYLLANFGQTDLKAVSAKRFGYEYTGNIPTSFKVRVTPEIDVECRQLIANYFDVSRITTPFLMRIVLTAYLMHLEGSASEATPVAVQPSLSEDVSSLKLELISRIIGTDDKDTLRKINYILKGE